VASISSSSSCSDVNDDTNNQGTRKNNQPISKPDGGEVRLVVCIDWQTLFLHFPLSNNVQDSRASRVTQQRKDTCIVGAVLNDRGGVSKLIHETKTPQPLAPLP
jgi:hypothetical protein